MIEYYNNELRDKAKKQQKSLLSIYLITVTVYLVCVVLLFFWETTLVYDSNIINLIRLVFYTISLTYIIFSFIYLGIKYRRVKKVLKFCYQIDHGIVHENEGTFYEYSESIQVNSGVDFKALIFLEWNQYKKDYFERKVLVFYERPFPKLEENKLYKFTTKGNVLMKYEEIVEEKK